MIIGFLGKMGAGKDEAYKQLKKSVDVIQLAFAGPLKDMVQRAWKFTDVEMKEKPLLVRSTLQIVGTEIFRNQIDENFWVKCINTHIHNNDILKERIESATKHIAVTDVRFENEAKWVKDCDGILIRIKRDNSDINPTEDQEKHASEVKQDDIECDFNINNDGTLEGLSKELLDILSNVKIAT